MRGAECWTDHRLVRAVLSLHIPRNYSRNPKTVRTSYNVARLKNPYRCSRFQDLLDERLEAGLNDGTGIEKWSSLRDTVAETAKEVLGTKTRTHEDWFDENDE